MMPVTSTSASASAMPRRRGRPRRGRALDRPRLREGGCCSPPPEAVFGPALYGDADRGQLPETAVLASLGCGNPAAVAETPRGEVVLDLGSGGGIDVLLSARRVGPAGRRTAST